MLIMEQQKPVCSTTRCPKINELLMLRSRQKWRLPWPFKLIDTIVFWALIQLLSYNIQMKPHFLMNFCLSHGKGFQSNDKLFSKLLQFQLILGHLVVVIQTCFRLISFRQTVTWMVTIIAPTIVQPVLFQCNLIKLICQNIQTI